MGFGKDDELRYSDLAFSLLLVSGVAIAWGRSWLFAAGSVRRKRRSGRALDGILYPDPGLAVVVGHWSHRGDPGYCTGSLAQVFRSGPVTSYRVQGAIAVYLLFGVGWAHAYHLTNLLNPGSFNSTAGGMTSVVDWAYYSYITLSTVGYGDITPVRPIARMLSTGEALTGQLYLAVLIARLVAMEVITWQSKTSQNSE